MGDSVCIGNLMSDAWHRKHPLAAFHFFGFQTWKATKGYCRVIGRGIMTVKAIRKARQKGNYVDVVEQKKGNNFVRPLGQLLLTLMYSHRACSMTTLAYYCSDVQAWVGKPENARKTVGRYVAKWARVLGQVGSIFCNLPWLDPAYVKSRNNQHIRDVGFEYTHFLVDGKDFLTDTIRKDSRVGRASWSAKSKTSAARVISCATLAMLYFAVSPLVLGKAEEVPDICRAMCDFGMLDCVPADMQGGGDKGFKSLRNFMKNCRKIWFPKLMESIDGVKQYSEKDVKENMEKCHVRYLIEVGYMLVTRELVLKDRIARGKFKHLHHLVMWGHGKVLVFPVCFCCC